MSAAILTHRFYRPERTLLPRDRLVFAPDRDARSELKIEDAEGPPPNFF